MTADDRPAVLRSLVLGVLLALVVSACTRHYPPAPVTLNGVARRSNAPTRVAAQQPRPDSIVVASGDTLYGVARRYDVPLRSLIEVNKLTPPFHLVSGQRLILPQVRQYVVQPGDTLYSVSRRFGVDASTLARTNELTPPFPIHTGQALILPAPVQVATVTQAAPAAGARTQPTIVPVEPPAARLRAEPAPQSPVPVRQVPVGAEPSAPPRAEVSAAPPPAQSAPPAPPTAETAPPLASSEPTAAEPAERQASAAPPAPEPPPAPVADPPHTGRGFQWPVRGSILIGFGSGTGGMHNDGINIAAAAGTPIAAANDGVVAYAGNELRGFGNLILLKHADGWMTAYAHCQTMLVKRGDRVRRGETIAKVGATGAVGEPQLHFEIRRGARALDPVSYLPPISTAAAD